MRRWTRAIFLAATPLLTACEGPYSALSPAGPAAQKAAFLWWVMCIGFTLVAVTVYGLWWHATRYHPFQRDPASERRIQRRWLIGGGVILPSVAITILLALGIPAGHRMLPGLDEEREVLRIDIEARQWFWRVIYPEQGLELVDEIHIPVDTPVDFHIRSLDVIHSFWVPRLGGKLDAIPGRTNVLRLESTEPGIYGGHCAEFCGTYHAHMRFVLVAHDAASWAGWLAQQNKDEESD